MPKAISAHTAAPPVTPMLPQITQDDIKNWSTPPVVTIRALEDSFTSAPGDATVKCIVSAGCVVTVSGRDYGADARVSIPHARARDLQRAGLVRWI